VDAPKPDWFREIDTHAPYDACLCDKLALQEQILVPGGSYHMGTDKIWFPQDAEGPAQLVNVGNFVMDQYEVSCAVQ
jgi:formylglycine-generating enzyme required for sulfatase activity